MYDYTDDDLAKLQKFADVVTSGAVVVCLTGQVIDEYERNREKKIADVLKQLEAKVLHVGSLPRICDGYEEATAISKLSQELVLAKKELLAKVRSHAEDKTLAADQLIQKIMKVSKTVEFDEQSYERAVRRQQLGNPPGKRESLGDQLNWELLLSNLAESLPLHVLSSDRDWASELAPGTIKPVLAAEWQDKKKATVTLLDGLNKFLDLLAIDVHVLEEPDKDADVQDLAESKSFNRTHTAIARLAQHETLNPSQLKILVAALNQNDQIYLIAKDADVSAFYARLVVAHSNQLSTEEISEILGHLNVKVASDVWL